MNDPNLPLLEAAVRLLHPLLDELVFVGGCATGLLITDPAAEGIRPTKDVDTITEVASYAEYATLSEKLRALNLKEDTREGAPTCRWRYRDLTIDVMPTDERILGFSNRWYAPSLFHRHKVWGFQRARRQRLQRNGWEAGIRTPIPWSRATCPTVGRPPNQIFRVGRNADYTIRVDASIYPTDSSLSGGPWSLAV
jgi:hypothetical protein